MLRKASMEKFHSYLEYNNMTKNKHQEDGIYWCIEHELDQTDDLLKGGIIADEMGLGKTILMLGLFVSNFVRNTLIVVPLPLLSQWKKEIKRTLGHDVLIYHGNSKKSIKKEELKDSALVLTTYGALKPSNKDNLYNVYWDRIIYDEAHHMRNSSSKKYFYGKLLKSKYRWFLSGTPVQNKIGDLYSLFHILGYKHKELINYETFKKLRKCHILRRKKVDVGMKLPDIHYKNVEVNWKNKKEKTISKKLHDLVENKITSSDISWIDCIGHQKIIQMVRAKQMCICPKMLEKKLNTLIKTGILDTSYSDIVNNTSKLDSVVEIIKERENNKNKKIIFCTFHEEMNILQSLLEMNNITSIGIYTGKLNVKSRQKVIDNSYNILLMQIQAGCEGLNLQEYNEVYFTSPHWNPSIEDQAIGRCYRMGQKKETYVFHFNMKTLNKKTNSMDKYVKNVQDEKRNLQEQLI